MVGKDSKHIDKRDAHLSLRSVLLLMPQQGGWVQWRAVHCMGACCQEGKKGDLQPAFSNLSHVPWCEADALGRKKGQFSKLCRSTIKQRP